MSEYYIGEIRLFPYTYAPEDWMECNGQILPIGQYQALFAVIGNQYGGSYPNTFALPDLRGNAPVGMGTGPGLSTYQIGKTQGVTTVSLTLLQMPAHQHALFVKLGDASQSGGQSIFVSTPANSRLGPYYTRPNSTTKVKAIAAFADIAPTAALASASVAPAGASPVSAHENRQPFQACRFCICVVNGIFPPRP